MFSSRWLSERGVLRPQQLMYDLLMLVNHLPLGAESRTGEESPFGPVQSLSAELPLFRQPRESVRARGEDHVQLLVMGAPAQRQEAGSPRGRDRTRARLRHGPDPAASRDDDDVGGRPGRDPRLPDSGKG